MKNYLQKKIVIEVTQPIGSFYIGKFTPKELHRIAKTDLSRYKDTEKGIQRDLNPNRINKIKEYVQEIDATFPNSIIIAIGYDDDNEPNWNYDEKNSFLEISSNDNVANIIDGQHRLFGLDPGDETFELPVSIFLGIPWVQQGIIFATINNNQRKVDQSLVYELYGLSEKRLVQGVSYKIVSLLNESPDSPWFTKIKMLGNAKNDGDISQGFFSKYLHERLLDKGKPLNKLFKEEKDAVIYKLLFNYFSAIKVVFPVYWENIDKEFILTKTTGFMGFMLFFSDLVKLSEKTKEPLTKDFFVNKIMTVKNNFKPFKNDYYGAGVIGQNKIRDILRNGLKEQEKVLINIK